MSEPSAGPSLIQLAGPLDGPDGAPVLVLGNSLGTSSAVWDRQAPVLRRHFRLLRYDLPGHGVAAGSPVPPTPYSIRGLGAGVLALLDAHGIDRAAYAGISLGGMIGMWLAANAPHRISALGLLCTSAYLPPASAWGDRAAQVRARGMTAISALVVGRWLTADYAAREPGVRAALTAELERTDPEGYAGCCEALAGMDLRSRLGAIAAPTLVIAGAEDPATPPPHGARIAAGINAGPGGRAGGARLLVVRGAAHLANISAAAEVSVPLLNHLRAVYDCGR
jgi:3-oxoadipate enol-lactonase